MSEQTATDNVPTPVQEAPSKSAAPKKAPKPAAARSLLSWINFLLIITLSAILGVCGWFGWQHHEMLIGHLAGHSNLHMEQQQEMQLLGQEVKALQTALTLLQKNNQELAQQNAFTADQLNKLSGASQQDWLIAEAEYLLRLANQRLQLEHDWQSALAMLQAADQILIETRNPQLTPVRQHLATEILALRQAPTLDRSGAVLRLQSLQQSLPQLPWLPSQLDRHVNVVETVKTNSEPSEAPWYVAFWDKISHNLHGLIRIRERNTVSEAPLTPDQQFYLQQTLFLMLEQAQVALLREDSALYETSLMRVSDWLARYFIVDNAATQAAQKSIAELQQWPVAPQRPDISQSLLSLQKFSEQQRRHGDQE